MDKPKLLGLILCCTTCVFFIAGLNNLYTRKQLEMEQYEQANDMFLAVLHFSDLDVLGVTINSPSIIVHIDTPSEFIFIAKEQSQDTIYTVVESVSSSNIYILQVPHYYIFNDDLTIAWKYRPEWVDFWEVEE